MTRVQLPPDLPWFDGHFPGRPVLPGVAQLALLDDLLRAEGCSVSGFARLRFRKEVLPGDEIDIEIRDDAGPGSVRFAVRRDGAIVSDGLARVRSERAGARRAGFEGMGGMGLEHVDLPGPAPVISLPAPDPALPPIEMLVPHRGAMRFVEALVASTADATTAWACVNASSPFARAGLAPIVLAIEIAAQTAAAGEAVARSRATGVAAPREGRLVGASEVALLAAGIPLGHPLIVSIVLAQNVPPLAIYETNVAAGGRVLATGKVSTYLV